MQLVVKGAFPAPVAVSACMVDVIDFTSSTSTTNSTKKRTVTVEPYWALASSIRMIAVRDMTERCPEVSRS
jgi:hypothetical protein